MCSRKVVLIGTLPPPIGGVTLHVSRLAVLLESSCLDVEFVDFRPRTKSGGLSIRRYFMAWCKATWASRSSLVHYHLNNWMEIVFLLVIGLCTRSRLITTVHSLRPEQLSILQRISLFIVTKSSTRFVAPSMTVKRSLMDLHVEQDRITVIDTFLPPSESELQEELPTEVMRFVNRQNSIVVANAFKLYLDRDGIDVYGLDMCIEACRDISGVSFVFCTPVIGDQTYYQRCLRKIEKYGIDDRFLIVEKRLSLVSLLRYASVFVRPTSTDSFGISVAEAISCGVPAIASDVCERADGAILFQSRNMAEFKSRIVASISESKEPINRIPIDYVQRYVDLYCEFS